MGVDGMTALDIFRECGALDKKIDRIQERIERRRALMTGCTARPMTGDGGSMGSSDASMRMLNYVSDIEALQADAREQEAARDACRASCLYLADMIPDIPAGVALRHYVEHKSMTVIATEMGYSLTHVKRLKRAADDDLSGIVITYWDHVNLPVCSR